MGCFTWTFANEPNKKLKSGNKRFYYLFPDNTIIASKTGYDEYGTITDANGINYDMYALLAYQNRFLFIERFKESFKTECINAWNGDEELLCFADHFIDGSQEISKDCCISGTSTAEVLRSFGIRCENIIIGLRGFPIKIVNKTGLRYELLPPSISTQ